MSPIKFEHLTFDHIVEFTKDDTLFAAAREADTGHLRIFLVNNDTGNVYARNGRADSWEEIYGNTRELLLVRLDSARRQNIPVYKINGTHNN